MCGRFTSTSSIEDLAETFGVEEVRTEPLPARWNVAPTDPVLAVATRRPADPVRALGRFRWGLVPSWARDPSVGSRMINARAESVADKPAYRKAFARRRCLIPADAFYEWQPRPDLPARGRSVAKQPWAIRLADGGPMALAGLWEVWHDPADPGAEPLRSCVIITTTANDLLADIHDRMPVVLAPDAWDRWLDPGVGEAAVEPLLVPAPAELFELRAVSSLVNDVRADGPELLEPVPA